jgi:hypothetical protein
MAEQCAAVILTHDLNILDSQLLEKDGLIDWKDAVEGEPVLDLPFVEAPRRDLEVVGRVMLKRCGEMSYRMLSLNSVFMETLASLYILLRLCCCRKIGLFITCSTYL